MRSWGVSAALIGLCLGLGAAIGPAEADKVGVAAAVNPDAFSSLAGAPQSQLNIGKSIFFNERINTTTSGVVQVLLVDGSTFTVGPDSDLVIDKFVYDPKKGTGQIAASFSKGVMRFVGGKISKNEDAVTVKTPAGALAIRGCIVQGTPYKMSFLFGERMFWRGNNGQTANIFHVGYTLDLTGGTPNVRPTTTADINAVMSSLTNGSTGGTNDQQGPTNASSAFQQTLNETPDELVNEATQTQIQDTLQEQQNQQTDNTPPPCTGDACNPPPANNTRILTRAFSYPGFGLPPNESPSNRGILGGDPNQTADDFTVLANLNEGETRVTGNFEVHNVTDDSDETVTGTFDFPVLFSNCNELGVCVIDGEDAAIIQGTGTETGAFTETLRGSAVVKPGFVAYELFPEFDENTIPTGLPEGSAFEDRIWMANALRTASGFLTNANLNDPVLVIAGQKYTMPQSDQLYEFALFTDPRQSLSFPITTYDETYEPVTITVQNFVAPFATLEGSPFIIGDGSNVQVSTLKVLANGGNGVWLQTSFHLEDLDGGQDSQVVVALGEATPNQGLTGERRGGASFSTITLPNLNDGPSTNISYCDCIPVLEEERVAYSGDIATIAGANGAHFLGTETPNIVIGTDTTNGNSPFLDKPLSDDPNDGYQSATYHVGTGSAPQAAPEQTSGQVFGYAAGIARTIGGEDEGALLLSQTPEEMKITFDATHNTLSGLLVTHVIDDEECDGECSEDQGGMTLVLGDNEDTSGRSAFIDDQHYAAIETPGQSSIQSGDGPDPAELIGELTGYLVSGEQLNVTSFFPETFEETSPGSGVRPFCTDCEFLKWGAWGARAGFVDQGSTNQPENSANNITADVHLGWWVAGDLASATDLDTLGNATATYNGHAIGNVANNLNGNGWKTYVAAGDLKMNWNFGPRTGDLMIDRFDRPNFGGDGLSFSGDMSAPGELAGTGKHFEGSLSGELPSELGSLSGSAAGSFVNDGDKKAAGVIGNWNVGNEAYKATGVFAGSGTPVPGEQ